MAGNVIHPTAVISPDTTIGQGVRIGPYAVIGEGVSLGDGCVIGPHAVVEGNTSIGKNVSIFQFASVGAAPQDIHYSGAPTRLVVGDNTVIRESVTIHRGTEDGGGITSVGSNCMIMAYCHVAHDCAVGDNVIMANAATLGGHVEIGRHAVIGGISAIHQFCRIGEFAFIGGMSGANKDIPPYVKYQGNRSNLFGLNLIGLRRHGFSSDKIKILRDCYRLVFHQSITVTQGLDDAQTRYPDCEEVKIFVDFIRSSTRGVPAARL